MDGQRSSPRSHGSWRPSDRRCRRGRSGGFERFADLAELGEASGVGAGLASSASFLVTLDLLIVTTAPETIREMLVGGAVTTHLAEDGAVLYLSDHSSSSDSSRSSD